MEAFCKGKMKKKENNYNVLPSNKSQIEDNYFIRVYNYDTAEFNDAMKAIVNKISFSAIAEKYYSNDANCNTRGNTQTIFGASGEENWDSTDKARLANSGSPVPRARNGSSDLLSHEISNVLSELAIYLKLPCAVPPTNEYEKLAYNLRKEKHRQDKPRNAVFDSDGALFLQVEVNKFTGDVSKVDEHADTKNCKLYSTVLQVNKLLILPCKTIVRCTIMGWFRSSVTHSVKRALANEETYTVIKKRINELLPGSLPGEYKSNEHFKQHGVSGMTVGINVSNGTISSVCLKQPAMASKYTGYTSLVIESVIALLEKKKPLRNYWRMLELMLPIAITNNHFTLSEAMMSLATSTQHPILDMGEPFPSGMCMCSLFFNNVIL